MSGGRNVPDRGPQFAESRGGLRDRPPHRRGRGEVAVVRIHRNPKPGDRHSRWVTQRHRRYVRIERFRPRDHQDRQGQGQILDAAGHRTRLDPFSGEVWVVRRAGYPHDRQPPTRWLQPVNAAAVARLADAPPAVAAQTQRRAPGGDECRAHRHWTHPPIDSDSTDCSCDRRADCPSRSASRVGGRWSYPRGSRRPGAAWRPEGSRPPPPARPTRGCPASSVCLPRRWGTP